MVARPLATKVAVPQTTQITLNAIHSFTSQRFASRDVGQLYQRIAEALRDALAVYAVAIWSCSELEEILTLQGLASPGMPQSPELTVAYEDISGPLENIEKPFSSSHPAIRDALEGSPPPSHFWRVLVQSTWNPHHTRIVVDLFHDGLDLKREHITFLSSSVAKVFDHHLDRIAFSVGADLNRDAMAANDEEDFGYRLKEICKKRLRCEAAALFLADSSETQLFPLASPELVWRADLPPDERHYEKGDGQLTTSVWENREPRFENRRPKTNRRGQSPKSWLPTPNHPVDEHRTLLMPIVDTEGHCMGLVRCVNKCTRQGNVAHFSDDDLVVLDHLLQQAIPTLRLRRAAEAERERLLVVTHELMRPVSALISPIIALWNEMRDEKARSLLPRSTRVLIAETHRWSQNLQTLVVRSRYIAGKANKQFVVSRQRTLLMGDIIAPTIAQLRHELRDKRLPESGLYYDDFETIPALYVDRNMFQQIFFNLLDNAIKYAETDASKFFVAITSAVESSVLYSVTITDRGIGIPRNMEDSLFRIGARGPNALEAAVGAGVGLWLVKQLVELHDGRVTIESYHKPTKFKIELPMKLKDPYWKAELK